MLAIYLFGQPRLLLGAQPFPFDAPPKTLPLLAYLLLHHHQPLERQQVAFALWPDDPEPVARANLRRHIHHLQRTLPTAPSDRPWLISDPRTIGWNPDAEYWLDVAEFEYLVSRSETITEAIQLYSGDLLETIYDDWIFFERERLRELYFSSLSQLVFQLRAQRNFPTAISFAQLLLSRDAFREDALRQLIALRYESGDRAGAIQEYETFERRLRQEMGISPMPETQALHESILRNARLPGVSTNPFVDTKENHSQPRTTPTLPFVGRTTEMEYLTTCWNRAAHGRGCLVLVGGEAGVGKTRLARELALLAEHQGARLLYGETAPDEPRPYQAVVDALHSALPLLAALEDKPLHLAALSTLIPKLQELRGLPVLPHLDPERERTRLFDSIATCMAKLAEPRPLLVILEDFHWGGEASVALLEFLAHRAAGSPMLVVATYRDEETPRIHPLRAMRRRLQSKNLIEHIPLSRLSLQDVESLVLQTSTEEEQSAIRLFVESEGNPLFIEMLWQQGLEDIKPDISHSEKPLHSGIRAAISRRFERLPAHAHAFAEIAAILGPAFDVEAAREVGGWDEAQAHDALRELLDCHLAREAEGRSRYDYVFAHHLIQATLYNEAPLIKRKRRHRRAAEVLESLYPEQLLGLAGELAVHYDLGGAADQAVHHYLVSAHQRMAVFADSEALTALDRAIQLADENQSGTTPSVIVDLLLARVSIHYRRGECDEQFVDLQRLEELTVDSPDLACEVLKRRILYHKMKDEHPAEREFVEILKRKAQALGNPHWQAEAFLAEGNYLKVVREFPPAISQLQEALALYQEIQDSKGQVACCCLLAEIFIIQRESSQAENWAQKALALCDEQQPSSHLMNTLWNLSANGMITKDLQQCLKYGERLLEVAGQANDRNWQAAAHRLMGMAFNRLFRITETRQHLEEALDLYHMLQKPKGCALTLQSLGNLEISLGHYDEARAYYQEAFDLQEKLNDRDGMATESINLAFAAAMAGDFAAEGEYSQRALVYARQIQNHFLEGIALQNLGESKRETNHLKDAFQYLREALSLLSDPSLEEERASVMNDLALTQWKAGDLPLALQTVDEILSLYPKIAGTDDNLHRFLWTAAQVLRAAGQIERARESLTQAHNEFQACLAAIPDAESCRAFENILYNRQIAAAHERDEWP